MVIEKKYCEVCRDEIRGRRDKKYCSDYCRALNYHQRTSEIVNYMRRVNSTIRKNRAILRELNPSGNARKHKMQLLDAGLNFDYFTNIFRTQSGKIYYFCYDQGYVQINQDYYALVVKKDYVN